MKFVPTWEEIEGAQKQGNIAKYTDFRYINHGAPVAE